MNEVIDQKCPNCGTKIIYNYKSDKWECSSCNRSYSLNELKKNISNNTISIEKYRCPDCGAEIITDKNTIATNCIFCGNTAIIRSRITDSFIPDYIIPFETTKEDFYNQFKKLLNKSPFLDNEYFNEIKIENIKGIYLPFFIYDVTYDGTLVLVSFDDNGKTYTNEKNVIFTAKDIPYDGSKYLNDDIMLNLFPYNLEKMKKYDNAYLSGFMAEKYDEDKEDLLELIKAKLDRSIECLITKNFNCDGAMVNTGKMKKVIDSKKYILLPVWVASIKNNKDFFVMNGQTKEIIGDIKIDKNKCMILYMITFILTTVLLMVILPNGIDLEQVATIIPYLIVFFIDYYIINSNKIIKPCNDFKIFLKNMNIKFK